MICSGRVTDERSNIARNGASKAIFGHGNVAAIGEAVLDLLREEPDTGPITDDWRRPPGR